MKIRPFIVTGLVLTGLSLGGAQTSPHGKLAIPCEKCHTTDSWKMRPDASFDHSTTGFPLEGKHKSATCVSCHKDLTFKISSQLCSSCHVDVHRSELGANCVRCHSLQSWKITDMIQRHQSTRFPLLGVHASLDCKDCHTGASNNQYTGTPTTCYGCHRSDFDNSKNPNHAFAGFSTDCSKCHKLNALQWSGGFDHALTGFPLSGAHVSVSCVSCHKNQIFKNTPQDCYSCHQTDYQSSTNPNHRLAGFATTCQSCHTLTAWRPSTFSHDNTKFPLTGSHRSVLCADCHLNNQFAGLPGTCFTCHQTDFNKTTNPNHVAGLLDHRCESCHTTTAWQPSSFDHSTTKFALTGAHAAVTCQTCHTNGNYQLVYTNCYQCHSTDFQSTKNPNHVTSGFSQVCQTCHNTSAWNPATFDHATTRFPLTGAHVATACATCHTNNNYQLVYSNCYQCHSTDFQGATNPNHVSGGFSQVCETCHSTAAWQPATFNHSTTKFPLTGLHITTACQSCHTNGNYTLSYSGCYTCHTTEYNNTTNPNHRTAGYPTTCETCHTTTAWTGATFNHTWFPTSHGNARGVCATCHTNPADFKVFQCTVCHTQSQMDPKHTGVRNYVFNSANCYSCHPRGTN